MMHSNHLGLPPELFRPILLFLSKKDLISAALVCQAWNEEASEVIWSTARSGVPLKALLSLLGSVVPGSEDNKLYRIDVALTCIKEARKERFLRLAASIKTIKIDMPLVPDSIQLLQDIVGEHTLLPRLQTLTFLTCGLFLTSPLMKLLRGSPIKHAIIMHVMPSNTPIVDTREVILPAAEVWAHISRFIPQIEVIVHQGFTLIPKGFVFSHLKFISATSPLFFLACFQSLALQPQLEDLHLEVQTYQRHAWDEGDRPVVLPHLTQFTLTYCGNGNESHNLLEDIQMPLLKEVDLGIPFGLQPDDIRVLCEHSPLVEDLRLLTSPSVEQEHLEYIGRFHYLKKLAINTFGGFSVPSSVLEGFFQGIANIESLVLSARPTSHELLPASCNFVFTMSTLSLIANTCKSLKTLMITVCIRPEQESVPPECAFANLKELGFPSACGSKMDIPRAANTIANMCRYSADLEFVGKESNLVYMKSEELSELGPSLSAAVAAELQELRVEEKLVTAAMEGVHL